MPERITRITTGTTILERLEGLAADLRRHNPGRLFIVDEYGVWARDLERGRDFGIYGTIITSPPEIMLALEPDGSTVLHRPIPEETTE